MRKISIKLISLLMLLVFALSFTACGGSGVEEEEKTIVEQAQYFGETYARGMVYATYAPTSIPQVYSTVRVISETKYIVSGSMIMVQDGYRYKGTFKIAVSYDEASDEFDVEDEEISDFYRE